MSSASSIFVTDILKPSNLPLITAGKSEYLNFILDCLSNLDNITYKSMMGEYLIYYEGKNIAGIYDNRLLLKNTDNLSSIMDEFILEKPYPNAKDMVVADNLEDSEYLANIFNFLYDRLPFPKKKK